MRKNDKVVRWIYLPSRSGAVVRTGPWWSPVQLKLKSPMHDTGTISYRVMWQGSPGQGRRDQHPGRLCAPGLLRGSQYLEERGLNQCEWLRLKRTPLSTCAQNLVCSQHDTRVPDCQSFNATRKPLLHTYALTQLVHLAFQECTSPPNLH